MRQYHPNVTLASAAYSKKKNCKEKKPIIELGFQKRRASFLLSIVLSWRSYIDFDEETPRRARNLLGFSPWKHSFELFPKRYAGKKEQPAIRWRPIDELGKQLLKSIQGAARDELDFRRGDIFKSASD